MHRAVFYPDPRDTSTLVFHVKRRLCRDRSGHVGVAQPGQSAMKRNPPWNSVEIRGPILDHDPFLRLPSPIRESFPPQDPPEIKAN